MAVAKAPAPTVSDTTGVQRGDQIFGFLLRLAGVIVIVVLVLMVLVLAGKSLEVFQFSGLSYFTGTIWDSVDGQEQFGTLAFTVGTVVTSILALLLATPLAVGAAIFVSEYAPRWLGQPIAFIVELLVTIPSVAYGLWGYLVMVPFLDKTLFPILRGTLGQLPLIGTFFQDPRGVRVTGESWLAGGIILAIMILPTILSLSREVISQVPRLQKEGMLALGATKWEMLSGAILPFAKGGIVGSMVLGLARAVGETMAVGMVVGNTTDRILPSLFTPGYTIASFIANNYSDPGDSPVVRSALVGLGLVLLIVATVFNLISRALVRQVTKMPGSGR